jgi:hypothetical protein
LAGGGLVELIADRGEAAESADFFRCRLFLDAEGVTHSLRAEARGWTIVMPVIVRTIPGAELVDATSPYGYPGASVSAGEGPPPEPSELDWTATGLVSLFARDRIGGEPSLGGSRERYLVQVHDPARPRQVRSRFAEQVRRNARLGYEVQRTAGRETSAAQRAAFHAAYTETMKRAGAAERYLFPLDYFEAVLGFERSWLLLAHSPTGEPCAGAIAAVSDGVLHYYLGGTADANLGDSPFKNVAVAMLDLADELGVPLNLGGGVAPGDGLEDFKRGFANAELPFHTHEVVCDAAAYARLSEGREAAGFFPVYRAP